MNPEIVSSPKPGDYFVVNMPAARLINRVSGWRADHAGIYVGGGEIVEAWPRFARLKPASRYENHDPLIWYSLGLSDSKRKELAQWAQRQVGTSRYGWSAGFGISLKYWTGIDTSSWYTRDESYGCAALVAHGYQEIGVPLTGKPVTNLVTPHDLDFAWN